MQPPEPDELELTVFGPGFGEAVLVHLGANKWIAIDSCISRMSGRCISLDYLDEIGVDPATDILAVIATHWHDDHVRGLSQLVEAAIQSTFYCSAALTEGEFLALASAFNKDPTRSLTGGMDEIYRIARYLADANRDIGMCGKDSTLLNLPGAGFPHKTNCVVSALSPSHRQYQLFMQNLMRPEVLQGQTKFRAPSNSPNHVSVAIHVVVGDISLLLGADLEELSNPHLGWQSVVTSPGRSQVKAMMFKVPHHGSQNGHYEPVWTRMLVPNPIAITTPFTRLERPLPTPEDRQRIRQYTSQGFLTTEGRQSKFSSSDPAVARTLVEMGATLRTMPQAPGRVSIRVKHGAKPTVIRSASSVPI